jgi:hypothetical protein
VAHLYAVDGTFEDALAALVVGGWREVGEEVVARLEERIEAGDFGGGARGTVELRLARFVLWL